MLSLLIIFLYITMSTGTLVLITKRKFGYCLVPSMIIATLVMYISQMLVKSFVPAVVINVLIAVAFPVLFFIKDYRVKSRENLITTGFWFYIFLFIFVAVVDYGFHFAAWDELSHWGMMVKEMFRTGGFYTEEASHLYVHKEYPPFMPLWELFLCMITGRFSEMVTGVAIHVMNFSMLFSVVVEALPFGNEKLTGVKRVLFKVAELAVFAFIILSFVLAMDKDRVIMTIYTDITVAMILVYGFSLIIFDIAYDGIWGVVALGLGMTSLVLTKQIGLVLALILIFYYFVKSIFCRDIKPDVRVIIMAVCGLVLIPFAFWYSWKMYSGRFSMAGQFDFERIRLDEVIATLRGEGSEESMLIAKTYLKRIMKRNLISGYFKIPLVMLFPMLLGIQLLIGIFTKSKAARKEALWQGITYICAVVGYSFTLFVMYLFCFPNEKPAVCYPRYMSSLVIPLVIALIYFCLATVYGRTTGKTRMIAYIVSAVVITVLLDTSTFGRLMPSVFKDDPKSSYREDAVRITEQCEKGSGIFIVANSNADYQYFVGYYANENIMDFRAATELLELDYNDEEVRASVETAMSENDYVYVKETNDSFDKAFSHMIEGESFDEETVYKVISDAEGIRLVPAAAD
ncbi:hypothetical protein [Butyrivibrio sp. FC2001]|uniref:hypothetical protein n=1 Tax=Butyrivibrio sp. FC2001 TaxID=1280671 RepID=UPI0003F76DBC|nr:hypothetical protein [Butyrivibrio sp. FC2001]